MKIKLPKIQKDFQHNHIASSIKNLLTTDIGDLIEEIQDLEENEIKALYTKRKGFVHTQTQALNVILLKVYKKFLEAEKPSDTILIANWLLDRSIGKSLDSDRVATIDKGDQKITYVTSISKTGDIDMQEIIENIE